MCGDGEVQAAKVKQKLIASAGAFGGGGAGNWYRADDLGKRDTDGLAETDGLADTDVAAEVEDGGGSEASDNGAGAAASGVSEEPESESETAADDAETLA